MIVNYCLECAGPLEKQNDTHYSCPNGHDFWNNPKAAAAIVIMDGDKILVSKRAREPSKGYYDLPGGFVDYGEDVFDSVVREMKEETALTCDRKDLRILTSYAAPYWENETVCDIVVIADKWVGTPVADDDSEALEWRDLSFLESDAFIPPYNGLKALLEAHVLTQQLTQTTSD